MHSRTTHETELRMKRTFSLNYSKRGEGSGVFQQNVTRLIASLTLSLPESNLELINVVLNFASVDETLCFNALIDYSFNRLLPSV